MKPHDTERHLDGEPSAAEPLFSAELRAELRRDLGPNAAARSRVRNALLSSVAAGALSPAAQRVDALLHAQAASAAGAKAATAVTVHSLTAKLVIASVLVTGGATAVVMRGPSTHERPAVVAPQLPVAPRERAPAQVSAAESSAQRELAPTQAVAAESPTQRELAPEAQGPTLAAPAQAKPSAEPARRHPKPLASRVGRAPHLQPGAASAARSVEAEAAPEPEPSLEPQAASVSVTATPVAPPPQPVKLVESAQASTPKHELAAEIALLRAASAALQQHNPQAALAQLRRHAQEFPHGALSVEAEALRAIALCTAHSEGAAAVSSKFLQAHAGAPLAERVRRACTEP